MTQFQPPPFPDQPRQAGYQPATYASTAPPPWSAAAIAGFVLSLLGFLGVTAVLGLILGIIGCFTTSGGRRRGKGLAIAAIPISVVMAVFSVLLVAMVYFIAQVAIVPDKLDVVLGSKSASTAEGARALREISSATLNQELTTEKFESWIAGVNAAHGKLTSTSVDAQQMMLKNPDGSMVLNFKGKFVNGPAAIRLTFKEKDVWSLRIDDIDIGGLALRGAAGAPTAKGKEPAATP